MRHAVRRQVCRAGSLRRTSMPLPVRCYTSRRVTPPSGASRIRKASKNSLPRSSSELRGRLFSVYMQQRRQG